ncbi:MAG: LCP family protein [Firmicutes bacterium]|nr:LCP family protein [Bacillota bacterium]
MAKKEGKKKKRRVLRVILIILLVLLVLVVGGVVGAAYYLFGGLESETLAVDDSGLSLNMELVDSGVTNIALFGVDTGVEDQAAGTRSDSIIILSLDSNDGSIQMTSILRDSKVAIEGYGETNINQAYNLGGPTLAIITLNQNFKLDIQDYVTVDFSQLANLVDAVGGVTLNLTNEEVRQINQLYEQYLESDASRLSGSGEMHVDGTQALAYARIRSIDSDTQRASRQQIVLDAMLHQLQVMPKSDYPTFIREFLGLVETSLSYDDILGLTSFAMGDLSIEHNTIPEKEYETELWGGYDADGEWRWIFDVPHAAERLHHIVYNTPYEVIPNAPEMAPVGGIKTANLEPGETVNTEGASPEALQALGWE